MKARKEELLTVVLFCGFLGFMLLCYILLPKEAFSPLEKRYLKETPQVTMENVLSGQFGEDVENYMADHVPGRNFFVGLNAYTQLLTGREVTMDIRVHSGGRLVEQPVEENPAAVQKNMTAIQAFTDKIGQQVDLLIVPSAGWAMDKWEGDNRTLFGAELYRDDEIIGGIYDMAQGDLRPVDVLHVLGCNPDAYFKTDHHWNADGAYQVYAAYMNTLDRWFMGREEYAVETVEGFYGSNYSRSGLWLTPADTLELWHSGTELNVTNGETEGIHEGVFYRERLEEADKYTVYLDGNHSVVRIDNPAKKGEGKLLVIRDSYSNLLGTFLAESYETVVMVDLRYYKKAVSELAAQEGFDDILVCYSLGNFMTDANIIWLR